MFETSLVESTSMLQHRSRWPMVFSFAAQAVLAGALIALPLLQPEALPLGQMHMATLAPAPPVRPAPQPLPRPVRIVATTNNAVSAPATHAAMLSITRSNAAETGPAPETSFNLLPAVAGTGSPFSVLASVGAPAGHSVGVATSGSGTLRISRGVSAGLPIAPIRPVYPRIAVASRVEGTVVVDAVITKSGEIASARVVSGSPMLQGAAIDAVRVARYRPYLLNGEPTEVMTTFSIVFRLGS